MSILVAGFLLLVGLRPPFDNPQDMSALQRSLKAKYQDKIVTLRHFYQGRQLVFGSDGELRANARVGSWTTCAKLEVRQLKVNNESLSIRGRRLFLRYDRNSKSFDDIGDPVEIKALPARLREAIARAQEILVTVQIAQQGEKADALQTALAKIFLNDTERLADVAPEYWRPFLEHDAPPTMAQIQAGYAGKFQGEPIFFGSKLAGVGFVTPNIVRQVRPDYTEVARMGKVSGGVVLSVIVDQNGRISNPVIMIPAGLELDESAVGRLDEWKFEPGTKDGRPVPVQATIEVTFRLY